LVYSIFGPDQLLQGRPTHEEGTPAQGPLSPITHYTASEPTTSTSVIEHSQTTEHTPERLEDNLIQTTGDIDRTGGTHKRICSQAPMSNDCILSSLNDQELQNAQGADEADVRLQGTTEDFFEQKRDKDGKRSIGNTFEIDGLAITDPINSPRNVGEMEDLGPNGEIHRLKGTAGVENTVHEIRTKKKHCDQQEVLPSFPDELCAKHNYSYPNSLSGEDGSKFSSKQSLKCSQNLEENCNSVGQEKQLKSLKLVVSYSLL